MCAPGDLEPTATTSAPSPARADWRPLKPPTWCVVPRVQIDGNPLARDTSPSA